MAHPLQQASVRRKVWYFAAILGLFTLSLFWRGKLAVPGAAALAGAADRSHGPGAGLVRAAAFVANNPIREQARPERLDLQEVDQGEAEVAASAVRLALTGSRGVVVAVTWQAAINKQRRNEFHDFEKLARVVTRLQPNFVLPWLYQGWNIAYNVSVETDKLGDMYFYIARGIELLSEGDRLNTKTVAGPDGPRSVGSPDLRKEIGFFYMNKFGVSDKVATLRCLMQLSCIPPARRDPAGLRPPGGGAGVDLAAFAKFCGDNPQLVRRLRTSLKLERPEEIVGFLEDNLQVPTRYTPAGELAASKDQYPNFPPAFPEGPDEFRPQTSTNDTFDAYQAARAWLQYGVATVPPPKKNAAGQAMPWDRPKPGEYNEFLYRMPRSPAYILYREQPCLAQTKLAERLAKEGWFDDSSGWDPDDRAGAGALWLKASDGAPAKPLTTSDSALQQWRQAYALWQRYGAENAMQLDVPALQTYRELADRVPGEGLPQDADFPPARLAALGIKQDNVDAKKALRFYEQNRSMTNYPYFLGTSEAEQDARTVAARKLLYTADQARQAAENGAAVRGYVEGLALLREVFSKYPQFHRPERSEQTEEAAYETELQLIGLLKEDGTVRDRAAATATALGAVAPPAAGPAAADLLQAAAEDEAGARIALFDPRVQARVRERDRERTDRARKAAGAEADAQAPTAHLAAWAVIGPAVLAPGGGDAVRVGIQTAVAARTARPDPGLARAVVDAEFGWLKGYTSPARDDPWVRTFVKDMVRNRLGLSRTQTPAVEKEGE